jgi:hypothetical protein
MKKQPKTTPRYKWKLLGVDPRQYAIYIVAISLVRIGNILNKTTREKLPNAKRYRIIDHVFIQHKKRKSNEKNRLTIRSSSSTAKRNASAKHGNTKRNRSTKQRA